MRIEVDDDELARASAALREEARDLLGLAAARARLHVDGDLLAGAALDPGGFAQVQAALAGALEGPHGLLAAGVALEVRAGQLLVAVARYRAADVVETELLELRRWVVLGPLRTLADPLGSLERALVEHPGAVDDAARLAGAATAPLRYGLLGPLPVLGDAVFRAQLGCPLLPRDLGESAGLLALLYRDGAPALSARPDDTRAATVVPAGVGQVLERLDHRNNQASPGAGRAGDIGLTRIVTTGPDGVPRVSWVIDLPGTKQWQPVPGARPGLNDLASNLELMAGTPNGRVQAVEQILRAAGVAAHEPVLLVGHSQGGMVAVRAAQELHGRYAVSHVVTAGSPVGGMAPPPGVQVLSLENRYDVVPLADGKDNREGQVTVVFEHQTGTVAGNHGTFSAYVPAAHALDRSADEAVRAWLDGAEAFLAGPGERTAATTTVYTVTNGEHR